MAQANSQFSGEYMVQDSDHLSGIPLVNAKSNRSNARQVEQSNSEDRHQGGERTGQRRRAHQ